jgi:hypothetical protein
VWLAWQTYGASSFQCELPCELFHLYPDAPLAHSIGTQVKQDWDKGETSLDSPPILRLVASASASPLANQKWRGRWPPDIYDDRPLSDLGFHEAIVLKSHARLLAGATLTDLANPQYRPALTRGAGMPRRGFLTDLPMIGLIWRDPRQWTRRGFPAIPMPRYYQLSAQIAPSDQ